MRTYFQNLFTLVCLATLSVLYLSAREQNLDTQRSSITIPVGKAGFLSVAGHEHWVRAPFSEGSLNATSPEHVTFRVDAKALNVMPDDTLSAEKQAEVQRTMQTEVLESDKYPEIGFRSTKVERVDAHHWLVTGDLTLHGQTHPVRVMSIQWTEITRARRSSSKLTLEFASSLLAASLKSKMNWKSNSRSYRGEKYIRTLI